MKQPGGEGTVVELLSQRRGLRCNEAPMKERFRCKLISMSYFLAFNQYIFIAQLAKYSPAPRTRCSRDVSGSFFSAIRHAVHFV